jgi:hypothetical protein
MFEKSWCAILGAGMVQIAYDGAWVWFVIWGVVLLVTIIKD